MQQRRPKLLAPRWRDLFDSTGQVLESQATVGNVSAGKPWSVGPVETKPRRNGLGSRPGFAQAAFEAAPTGSSWGLPPFELRWRAGSLSPALLRVGAAITMATTASRPCAGGSRDILWRVSAALTVVCAGLLMESGWVYGRRPRVRFGRGRDRFECSVGSAWGYSLQGCVGLREWKLVTGWEGHVGESWLQGVCLRAVLSAVSLQGERSAEWKLVGVGGIACREIGRGIGEESMQGWCT